MFFGQGATFLANFPFVVWLDEVRDFTVAEVGSITIVGAVGNALGSYFFGLLFDRFTEKRLIHLTCVLLSVVPYTFFIFIEVKPLLFLNYFFISAGYGGLYTVQVSQMRLLADRTVAAAYAGLCMGSLSLAAAAGTVVGGFVGELVSYEAVFVRPRLRAVPAETRAGATSPALPLLTAPAQELAAAHPH
jgi:predicted MFS family arabinose efflux permease